MDFLYQVLCGHHVFVIVGSGLVVAYLPAAREGPGSNGAVDKSLCFRENHCDTQLWARAAH